MMFHPFLKGQTMQMMYDIIAQEIKAAEIDAHPTGYLNFYCLGNREEHDEEEEPNMSCQTSFNGNTVMLITSHSLK